MTKKFKNTIVVTSDIPEMVTAFQKWSVSIGYEYNETYAKRAWLALHGENSRKPHLSGQCFLFENHDDIPYPIYHLPAQWSEAMKAAEEVVEESVYKTGNKVRNRFDTIVHCSGKETGEHFYGQIISTKGHGRMGLYRKWNKLDFTLHTDPVTI